MYLLILLCLTFVGLLKASDVTECSCGFLDTSNSQLYTDSIIVYFNETEDAFGDVLTIQDFEHKKEKGWNALYRRGAIPENVVATNTSIFQNGSLELWIDPANKNHLVNGASIRSMRQDILHGSFRASMKSPRPGFGGSALSMILQHNVTSSMEIDMCNTDFLETARVTYLHNGEFPDTKYGTNYSTLVNASVAAWDFVEVKMDWTKNFINYTIAQNKTRTVKKKAQIPTEPLPLAFQHWSTGDAYWTEGPPRNRSVASVAWIRAFFNSSLTTATTRKTFDERCRAPQSSFCSVDDTALRGATAYAPAALKAWKEPPRNRGWRIPSAIGSGGSAFIGLMTLLNVIYRRQPWRKWFGGKNASGDSGPVELLEGDIHSLSTPTKGVTIVAHRPSSVSTSDSEDSKDGSRPSQTITVFDALNPDFVTTRKDPDVGTDFAMSQNTLGGNDLWATGANTDGFATPHASTDQLISRMLDVEVPRTSWDFFTRAHDQLRPYLDVEVPRTSWDFFDRARAFDRTGFYTQANEEIGPAQSNVDLFQGTGDGYALNRWAPSVTSSEEDLAMWSYREPQWEVLATTSAETLVPGRPVVEESEITSEESSKKQPKNVMVKELVPPQVAESVPPPPKTLSREKRVDYLAGLVTFACLGVTVMHFMLTFVPYAGGMSYGMHYKSEYWFRWTIQPFYLNPIWLGPFFVTSCRFLAGKYLRGGSIADIAEKVLMRAMRMVLPCVIIAFFEYFFIEQGLLSTLEWLPSVSWSSWPWIVNYNNFGIFINDALELAYLIPNAAPQMTNHFCTGILWTVPVQLQFSYTALLAAVLVRDIKTHWKRFGFYAFCIVLNWYSRSWGSCFWAGVLLADLQITYHASKWIQARPLVHYPLCIFLAAIALLSGVFSLLEDRLGLPVLTDEKGIHPDVYTGLPLSQTSGNGYPDYFEPRFNTLMFSISMQLLVETSTAVQWFLSLRIWQPIFPYAYTIYLVHGFIFWSLGSYLAVTLFGIGVPYWANMLVTAFVCYTVLGITVKLISPLTEDTITKACQNIARWATEIPVPKKSTLWPFDKNLLDRKRSPSIDDEEAVLNERAGSPLEVDAEQKKDLADAVTAQFEATEPTLLRRRSSTAQVLRAK